MKPATRTRFLTLPTFDNGNAAVETFFKTPKAELVWRHTWATPAHVNNALYNTRRKHSAIGGTSSVKFERLSA